ncbi:MAG: hypothetical protein JSV78_14435 [Phycisphaerales bacterium]|nr:MAG: hypothetical protein JSV78_14435 [Phycisphaerales bacterium]
MAAGEGADWEIKPKDVKKTSGTVYFELKVSSLGHSPSTQVDVVQMQIKEDDTPVTAAMKLAQEWNTQTYIDGVFACVATPPHVTAFLPTPDLAIAGMAITFPDQPPTAMKFNEAVIWDDGAFKVTRVQVDVSPP